jgi:hypothetical protein
MSYLQDGFSTTISFSDNPTILLDEVEITPPGIEGGGEISQTSMNNTAWRTSAPKSLKTLANSEISAGYGADTYGEIVAMLQTNQLITVTFPDGSTIVFWGWLDTFVPDALVEGERPTASLTIIPSNLDASNAETAPVFATTTASP